MIDYMAKSRYHNTIDGIHDPQNFKIKFLIFLRCFPNFSRPEIGFLIFLVRGNPETNIHH